MRLFSVLYHSIAHFAGIILNSREIYYQNATNKKKRIDFCWQQLLKLLQPNI